MAYGGAKDRRGFQCWKYGKGQCDESHYISVGQIEALVIGYLEQVTLSSDISYSVITAAASDNGSRISELERQLQKIDAKEKRIKAAYQNGIDSLDEYKANKAAINDERRIIEESIRELTPAADTQDRELLDRKMRQNISDLLSVIKDDSVDYVKKGNMMRNVVDHIVFNRKETSLDVFLKLVI